MKYITGAGTDINGQTIKKWFEEQIGESFDPGYSAMAFMDKDKIKSAALFNNYNGHNIEFHWYSGKSISRGNFRTILNYVFNILECNRLSTIPHRSHIKTLMILPRLGFFQEAILKNYYGIDPPMDGLLYVIDKERAKYWLKTNGDI